MCEMWELIRKSKLDSIIKVGFSPLLVFDQLHTTMESRTNLYVGISLTAWLGGGYSKARQWKAQLISATRCENALQLNDVLANSKFILVGFSWWGFKKRDFLVCKWWSIVSGRANSVRLHKGKGICLLIWSACASAVTATAFFQS